MYIDTHCHLNFKAFAGGEAKIIRRAQEVGVTTFVVPGTDMVTSQLAVSIAQANPDTFAVVGIHPHHAAQYQGTSPEHNLVDDMVQIEKWLLDPKVVGIGEIGLDRHAYTTSRYGPLTSISEEIFNIQKDLLTLQIDLAVKHKKSVVIHNREAVNDLISLCNSLKSQFIALKGRGVLHCCESDERLLNIAKELGLYIGVDGDITYSPEKKDFIRMVPLEMIVLETDSPYLLPEPLKTAKKYPNTPSTIPLIAQAVADLKGASIDKVGKITTENAIKLFNLDKHHESSC